MFWLIYYITLSNGIVLAYFIAAISPNLDVANALLPTYVVTLLFFGGFLFKFDDMPPWWKWYSYIGESWVGGWATSESWGWKWYSYIVEWVGGSVWPLGLGVVKTPVQRRVGGWV